MLFNGAQIRKTISVSQGRKLRNVPRAQSFHHVFQPTVKVYAPTIDASAVDY